MQISRSTAIRALLLIYFVIYMPEVMLAQDNTAKSKKHALIVGISKYARGSKQVNQDWWNLNTANDVQLLKQTLVQKYQFDPTNVKVLVLPEETTHKAIISAFRSHLIEKTGAGDIVFFHFSGHGQQIPDDNGDEIDGLDESIIPSDYISQSNGSRNIRDDEIAQLLEELSEKKPSNVTVTLDSCYSGTGTRGDLPVRGGPWRGEPVKAGKIKGIDESPSGLTTPKLGIAKGYVFISAAASKQTAKETFNESNQQMGLFTWALVKALDTAGPDSTYRDIYERLNDYMSRKQREQNPQIEGDLDKILLNGTAIKTENYHTLSYDNSSSTYSINAGKLQGITKGSIYGVYPEGTKSTVNATKITEGEIVYVEMMSSVIKLAKPVNNDKIGTMRVFETNHNYADPEFRIATQDLESLKHGDLIKKSIESYELIKTIDRGSKSLSNQYNILIHPPSPEDIKANIVNKEFKGCILERQNGDILALIEDSPTMVEKIKMAIEKEMKWNVIKSLESNNQSLQVELRIVPVEVELHPIKKSVTRVLGDKPKSYGPGNQLQMNIGDHFMLEVRNIGNEPAYVNILNLRTDQLIGPGWPQNLPVYSSQNDNLIPNDHKWRRIGLPYVFRTEKPAGQESFRAIATQVPIDLSRLIDQETYSKRGSRGGDDVLIRGSLSSVLGRIIYHNQKGTRSGVASSIPELWSTASATFDVLENK